METEDNAVGSGGEHDIRLGNRSDRAVDNFQETLSVSIFLSASTIASTEPWVSALTTILRDLAAEVAMVAKRFSSVTLLRFSLASWRVTMARVSPSSRAAFSFSRTLNSKTGFRNAVQAQELYGHGGTGFLEALAFFVNQGANAAPKLAADNDIAHMQGAFANEHGGGRTARSEAGLDHIAFGAAIRVGFQFEQVGLEDEHLQKLIDALFRQSRNIHENGIATPFIRNQALYPEAAGAPSWDWRSDDRTC